MTDQPPGPGFLPPGQQPEPPIGGPVGAPPPGPGTPPQGFPPTPPPGSGFPSGPPPQEFPSGPPPQGFPPGPPHSYPPQPGSTRPRGRGSIVLGIGITYATFAAAWFCLTFAFTSDALAGPLSTLSAVLPMALIVVGIVLAALPKTTRTGAGILIGIGSAILVAGGLCVALLSGLGR
ncbi:hypothetical protein ATK74_2074 [Propionicimonas paludicola]|uniref:Uncharacterized protein n=1 Tax=Propionicimonas paludicola TaxID=185243 RepID=A0A2A9CTM6_9ACTN|nr:hypothetical protein [Propionicimonas paludicola]PFG17501.1 hypothetical protein ATK74_2074 [Propionicimonas paludicola]